MYYTGFADEVSGKLDLQIKATKELGWKYIESRNIDGENITDISDEKFKEVRKNLDKSGIMVNCFGSAVANWGKNPVDEKDFEESLNSLKRAIPRMKELGTEMIRGMSFGIPESFGLEDSPELENKIIDKMKTLIGLCEEAEIYYLHENCMNYFSQSYNHMDRMIEEFDSPFFKVVFDTGNPVFSDNRIGDPPYKKQSSWKAYQHLKKKIHYLHIKDGVFLNDSDGIFPETRFTFPDEGDGDIKKILKDLLASGYDGGISIEPHMGSVYHDDNKKSQSMEESRYNVYIDYGKKIVDMIENIKTEL